MLSSRSVPARQLADRWQEVSDNARARAVARDRYARHRRREQHHSGGARVRGPAESPAARAQLHVRLQERCGLQRSRASSSARVQRLERSFCVLARCDSPVYCTVFIDSIVMFFACVLYCTVVL